MSDRILVAYSTKYGSTAEVADAVAANLRADGLPVDLKLMKDVSSLADYRAVFLGTALYMGHIHADARRFLAAHQHSLEKLPVALFVLGPVHNDASEWPAARAQLAREIAKFPWFAPINVEVFGGKFDPDKLKFPFTLLPVLSKMPASDARDWDAIRRWTERVARVSLETLHFA
jgi:menaquinone-dependent protoporphyrinogen oxidase